MMHSLKAGTVLYHGTNNPDFDEADDDLDGPAWLTDSKAVATNFATRNLWDKARPRILEFVLEKDVELHMIRSTADLHELADEHGICLMGVEDMRDSVANAGIPGWIIPNNYPEGADILLADTSVLRYLSSISVAENNARRKMRP